MANLEGSIELQTANDAKRRSAEAPSPWRSPHLQIMMVLSNTKTIRFIVDYNPHNSVDQPSPTRTGSCSVPSRLALPPNIS